MKIILSFLLSFFVIISIAQPPAPRHTEQIIFDPNRKILVMHGGGEVSLRSGLISGRKDINEWKNGEWKRIPYSADLPEDRQIMIYNTKEKVIMLIGGVGRPRPGTTGQSDVWEWNEKTWERVNIGCPLIEMEAVYDPINTRVLAYGNANVNGGSRRCELWEFKSNTWKKLSATAPAFSDASFSPYEIAFNEQRNSLVLLTWENGKSVVWEWRNEQWQKTECTGECPSDRYYFSLAYHKKDKAIYMFGGRNNTNAYLDELWRWDEKWTKVESKEGPSMRCAATLEYGDESLILYGGVAEWGTTNEMWQWKNNTWKLLNGEYAMSAARKLDSLKFLMVKYPTEGNLYYEYGSIINRMTNQTLEVEQAYKKAVELNAAQPMHLFYLVDFLYKQNKSEDAEQYLTSALASGKPRDFYYRVGRVLMNSRRYAEGIRFYEKANQLEPRGGDFYNVACAYSLLGNKDKAFENLNSAAGNGYNTKNNFESDADLESLRSDPRWNTLLEKLK